MGKILDKIDSYRLHPGINQSLIKSIITGKKFDDEEVCYRANLECGNLLDLWITIPEEEWIDKLYIQDDVKIPGEKAYKAIHYIWQNRVSTDLDENVRLLSNLDYYSNWTLEKRMETLKKDSESYWYHLAQSEGKWIIGKNEWEKASKALANYRLVEDQIKSQYKCYTEEFQKDIYFSYKGLDCKQLLDIVYKNDKDEVICVVDIKYTENISYAKSIAKKLRYEIQAAFCNLYYENIPFIFVFCAPDGVQVYEVTKLDLNIGRYGLIKHYTVTIPYINTNDTFSYEMKGIEQAFEEIINPTSSNLFEELNLYV